jgi:hypothetical protein
MSLKSSDAVSLIQVIQHNKKASVRSSLSPSHAHDQHPYRQSSYPSSPLCGKVRISRSFPSYKSVFISLNTFPRRLSQNLAITLYIHMLVPMLNFSMIHQGIPHFYQYKLLKCMCSSILRYSPKN